MTTGKTIALTRQTFVDKVMSLLFNMLSRLVITFLPRSKRLLISWLQSPWLQWFWSPPKIKSATVSPFICHEVMGLDATILVFWMLSFKPTFSLSSFIFKRLFSSSLLSAISVVSSAYLRLLIFLLGILIPACASWWVLLREYNLLVLCGIYATPHHCLSHFLFCFYFLTVLRIKRDRLSRGRSQTKSNSNDMTY